MQLSPHAMEIEKQEREANHARLMQIVEQRRAQWQANERSKIEGWLGRPMPIYQFPTIASRARAAQPKPTPIARDLPRQQDVPHRAARLLTLNGETHTAKEWSKLLDLPVMLIWDRLRKGWSIEDVLKPKQAMGAHRRNQADAQVEIPGVSSNFTYSLGTGAGRHAQDSSNIAFQKDDH